MARLTSVYDRSSYLEERMKMYEEWVYISQVCLDMNDFSSTAAIVAALMSPMVSKLVLTCESKAKKRLLKLDRDLTPTNGAYQDTLNQAETNNLIPWLDPHLSILKSTFAHFNPIVEVDGHPLIDFRLCRELAEQIDTLVQYSSPRVDSETRQDVLEYVEYNIQSSSADNAASGVEARGAELAREEQAMLTQRERAQALGRPWLPHQDRLEMARRGEEDTVRSRETDRTRWDEEMVRRRAEEATRWREDMSRWGEGMARQREEDMARQREEDMARQREEDLVRQREEATARQRMAQQRKEFELQIEKGVAQQFEDMTLRAEEDKARQREEVAAWPHEDVAQGRKGLGEGEATVRGHDETGTVQQREDTALRLKGDTSRRHEDDMLPRRGRLMSRVFGSKSGKKP
ncbi:hypothetical protein BC826DRAFT_1007733 [Russula brevipes]|nr:hypothetical protein BC826DRAFT_1007733 [Russula brevipes]